MGLRKRSKNFFRAHQLGDNFRNIVLLYESPKGTLGVKANWKDKLFRMTKVRSQIISNLIISKLSNSPLPDRNSSDITSIFEEDNVIQNLCNFSNVISRIKPKLNRYTKKQTQKQKNKHTQKKQTKITGTNGQIQERK